MIIVVELNIHLKKPEMTYAPFWVLLFYGIVQNKPASFNLSHCDVNLAAIKKNNNNNNSNNNFFMNNVRRFDYQQEHFKNVENLS